MKRIDQVLGGEAFKLDLMACAQSASIVQCYRSDIEETPWGKLDKNIQLAFKLAFISICHDFNWDYMQSTLAAHLLNKGEGQDIVEQLSHVTARELGEWLSGYPKQERVRGSERAAFLRDVGKKLQERHKGSAVRLFQQSNQKIAGKGAFLEQLDIFEAFSKDPLRKKSNVLIHDLVREGVVRFSDEENIAPAIDYHIMRLYLRTGRVIPANEEIKIELKGSARPRPRLVKLLREATSRALVQTAHYAKLTVPELNYIEWQIGRAVCIKDCPSCQSECSSQEIADDVQVLYSSICPYMDFCEAFSNEEFRAMKEPELKTTFY